MIECFIIGMFFGMVLGFITHEKIFPEHKTVNEITQSFKVKNSEIKGASVLTSIPTEPVEQLKPLEKRRGFFRRIFSKRTRPDSQTKST